MERNFTIKTGFEKETKHFAQRLISFLSLFLFTFSISFADVPLDVIVTSTDVTCSGANDGTATATPIDGWAPFTYEWSNGETTQTITGLAPGLYEVTVIDVDGAIAIGETIVEEDPIDLFLSASYETCPGSNDASASVNVSGGIEPLTYLWSNGDDFVVAENLSAGIYTVTVTDANGCTAEGSIEVELSPEGLWIMLTSTPADCGLDNGTAYAGVMTGVPPYVFEWSNGGSTQTITDLAPGTYSVTVTDSNGCTNSDSVDVESNSDLNLDISGVDADCGVDNGSATVTVNGGTAPFTYNWSNGENTATITNLAPGTYSVTVTDINNCSNVASIEIEGSNGITLTISGVDADCNENNGSATANPSGGTSPYTYEWSNGETTQTITDLAPGTYSVTVSDANGCGAVESVTIDGENVDGGEISTNDNLEICAGDGNDDIVNVDLMGKHRAKFDLGHYNPYR